MDVRIEILLPLIGLVERWLLLPRLWRGGDLPRLLSCTLGLDYSRVLRILDLVLPIVERLRGHKIFGLCLGCRESAVDKLLCSAAATDLVAQLPKLALVFGAPGP